MLYCLLLCSLLQVRGFMSGCCAPAFGCVVLHVWLSCSRLRVCGASCLAVVLPPSDGWGFMAGCCAPSFRCAGLHGLLSCSRLRVGREPRGLRPHIAAGHPCRGTHPPLSAAALSLKWFYLRIFFNRLFLYLSII